MSGTPNSAEFIGSASTTDSLGCFRLSSSSSPRKAAKTEDSDSTIADGYLEGENERRSASAKGYQTMATTGSWGQVDLAMPCTTQ